MKQAQVDSFGYSDTRLWYALVVFSGGALFLIPMIGSFWALITLLVPAILVSVKAAERYTKTYADIDREMDEYIALAEKAYNFDIFTKVPTFAIKKKTTRTDRSSGLYTFATTHK